jgi:hypothetical protein
MIIQVESKIIIIIIIINVINNNYYHTIIFEKKIKYSKFNFIYTHINIIYYIYMQIILLLHTFCVLIFLSKKLSL